MTDALKRSTGLSLHADNECVQPYQAQISGITKADRRRQPRYNITDVVEVYVAGRDGRFLGWGTLRDISETGASIHMDHSVERGAVVELMNARGKMIAVCRHANAGYTGFVLGFEFLDDSEFHDGCEWSPLPATW